MAPSGLLRACLHELLAPLGACRVATGALAAAGADLLLAAADGARHAYALAEDAPPGPALTGFAAAVRSLDCVPWIVWAGAFAGTEAADGGHGLGSWIRLAGATGAGLAVLRPSGLLIMRRPASPATAP